MRSYETEPRIVGPQAGNQTTPGAEHIPQDESGAYAEDEVATTEEALDSEGGGTDGRKVTSLPPLLTTQDSRGVGSCLGDR